MSSPLIQFIVILSIFSLIKSSSVPPTGNFATWSSTSGNVGGSGSYLGRPVGGTLDLGPNTELTSEQGNLDISLQNAEDENALPNVNPGNGGVKVLNNSTKTIDDQNPTIKKLKNVLGENFLDTVSSISENVEVEKRQITVDKRDCLRGLCNSIIQKELPKNSAAVTTTEAVAP